MEGVTTGFGEAATVSARAGNPAGADEQLQAEISAVDCATSAGWGTIDMLSMSGLGAQQEAASSPVGCVIIGSARGTGCLAIGAG